MTITLKQDSAGAAINDVATGLDLFRFRANRGGYIPPENFVHYIDDFLGDSLAANWSGAAGTNGSAAAPAVVLSGALAAKGHVVLTTGATTVMAESACVLTQGLNWKPSYGQLHLKASINLPSIANVSINVGFADVLATTTLREAFSISGTTITSNASNAACFVFDTAQTNAFWHIQGVKADTDTAINNTGIAPVAATVTVLDLIIDTSGNATFFIDGTNYGTVANAVTATTLLTPHISLMSRTTASKTMNVDYVYMAQPRSTLIS